MNQDKRVKKPGIIYLLNYVFSYLKASKIITLVSIATMALAISAFLSIAVYAFATHQNVKKVLEKNIYIFFPRCPAIDLNNKDRLFTEEKIAEIRKNDFVLHAWVDLSNSFPLSGSQEISESTSFETTVMDSPEFQDNMLTGGNVSSNDCREIIITLPVLKRIFGVDNSYRLNMQEISRYLNQVLSVEISRSSKGYNESKKLELRLVGIVNSPIRKAYIPQGLFKKIDLWLNHQLTLLSDDQAEKSDFYTREAVAYIYSDKDKKNITDIEENFKVKMEKIKTLSQLPKGIFEISVEANTESQRKKLSKFSAPNKIEAIKYYNTEMQKSGCRLKNTDVALDILCLAPKDSRLSEIKNKFGKTASQLLRDAGDVMISRDLAEQCGISDRYSAYNYGSLILLKPNGLPVKLTIMGYFDSLPEFPKVNVIGKIGFIEYFNYHVVEVPACLVYTPPKFLDEADSQIYILKDFINRQRSKYRALHIPEFLPRKTFKQKVKKSVRYPVGEGKIESRDSEQCEVNWYLAKKEDLIAKYPKFNSPNVYMYDFTFVKLPGEKMTINGYYCGYFSSYDFNQIENKWEEIFYYAFNKALITKNAKALENKSVNFFGKEFKIEPIREEFFLPNMIFGLDDDFKYLFSFENTYKQKKNKEQLAYQKFICPNYKAYTELAEALKKAEITFTSDPKAKPRMVDVYRISSTQEEGLSEGKIERIYRGDPIVEFAQQTVSVKVKLPDNFKEQEIEISSLNLSDFTSIEYPGIDAGRLSNNITRDIFLPKKVFHDPELAQAKIGNEVIIKLERDFGSDKEKTLSFTLRGIIDGEAALAKFKTVKEIAEWKKGTVRFKHDKNTTAVSESAENNMGYGSCKIFTNSIRNTEELANYLISENYSFDDPLKDRKYLEKLLKIGIFMMILAGFGSFFGASIIEVYAFFLNTINKLEEFTLLKALGADDNFINRLFFAQSIIIGFCSYILGVILAGLLVFFTKDLVLHLVGFDVSGFQILQPEPMYTLAAMLLYTLFSAILAGKVSANIIKNKSIADTISKI